MFNVVSRIKEKIINEINEYENNKNSLTEEVKMKNETDLFLTHLSELSKVVCPFKNPASDFENFREYPSIDEIRFTTPENKYSISEVIKMTGLKSVSYDRGWTSDKWKANYREYSNLFESGNIRKASSAKSAILSMHTTILNNKSDYSNFTFRYLESVANICSVIEEYGVSFIYENQEVFNSVFNLIADIASEYKTYSDAIREYKKGKALEKLQMERDYIEQTIKKDTLMLEFDQR